MTNLQFVNLCKNEVGVKEIPVNNVLYNTHYYGREVNGSDYPWCVTFVWDMFRKAGLSRLLYNGEKTAYCPTLHTWAIKNNLVIPYSQVTPGDLVLFIKRGVAYHIGVVAGVKGSSFTTIEGNTNPQTGVSDNGGEVASKTYDKKNVSVAFVKIHYSTFPDLTINMTREDVDCYKDKVVLAQASLRFKYGYYSGSLDGVYGNSTQKAVRKVQEELGFTPTGNITEELWSYLI